jgi:two-component system OmpR family response regulator
LQCDLWSKVSGHRVTLQALKVLLVEDSSVLAERMAETIRQIPEIELIGTQDSEEGAVLEIRRRRVDVVLLDLQLKQGSGFGVLRAIGSMQRKPCVVVLTNHDSAEHERSAVELGAQYFLDKARDFARLPEILRRIVNSGGAD